MILDLVMAPQLLSEERRVSMSQRILRYEIAKESQRSLIFDFMMEYFRVLEPITASLGTTIDEIRDFFDDLVSSGLTGKFSLLAFEDNRLAGVCLNCVKEVKETSDVVFKLKPDYKSDILNGEYTYDNANRIATLVSEIEKNISSTTPNASKIFKIDVICVNPYYARQGIAKQMVEQSLKLAKDLGCQYAASCATAVASQYLFDKLHFSCAREIPFASYKEGGLPIFRNLRDGGRSAKLMVRKL
ncbi:hypothetical protein QR680_007244 [Steinernema hermaphroditum]|uniref:aralkylamine N-acetyltransferase n=1 Tax=Steinernema hermaphroditum TaxID=289476 RepID=A0AA39HY42_9BILA|nr:hypothetical protein QR680_007244 [Steinernema hermaphroditum]